jgi:hypothetical protein
MTRNIFYLKGFLCIIITIILFELAFSNPAISQTDNKLATANKITDLTYDKEAIFQPYIKFAIRSLDESIKNTPKLKNHKDVLLNVMREVYTAYFNDTDIQKQLKNIYSNIYMEEFTEEELKDILKFYQTPTGKKCLKEQPVIAEKIWKRLVEIGRNMPVKYKQMMDKKLDKLIEQGKLPKDFKGNQGPQKTD